MLDGRSLQCYGGEGWGGGPSKAHLGPGPHHGALDKIQEGVELLCRLAWDLGLERAALLLTLYDSLEQKRHVMS